MLYGNDLPTALVNGVERHGGRLDRIDTGSAKVAQATFLNGLTVSVIYDWNGEGPNLGVAKDRYEVAVFRQRPGLSRTYFDPRKGDEDGVAYAVGNRSLAAIIAKFARIDG